jgi:hypothetical protein
MSQQAAIVLDDALRAEDQERYGVIGRMGSSRCLGLDCGELHVGCPRFRARVAENLEEVAERCRIGV